jgi:UrcA family protein
MTMNTIIRTKLRAAILSACAATSLCTLHTTVQAAADGLPTKTVSYADLDISKPAGAKTLYRRIQAAARQVCAVEYGKDLDVVARSRGCMKQAVDMAVKSVDSGALSKLNADNVIHLASN